ncbi:Rrf2 family transcriptional regulator [Pelagicoccus sp. SDUM812003]|uniref:RrF2 family transcriptional regulator n=1 Tax=Pelagicoccus sp. SDUM812003 TaxID=3041267 RepID=UPI00280D29B4|nr:Rrf2 family transcriptional regulator [Pelagicoccus sp. SDUM812003]MDQ8203709.1 Rrf2 family transcriptional regulator [Pelagicoccus sp. SDUM812003]
MELTKFSDYSLRLLIYLALNDDRLVSLQEVADAYQISRNHLVKIAGNLNQLGYVQATRGKGGGLRLAKAPRDINAGQLVRLTEGDAPLIECFDPVKNSCCLSPACVLKGALKQAENAFYSELERFTLADLVKRPENLRRQFPSLSESRVSE